MAKKSKSKGNPLGGIILILVIAAIIIFVLWMLGLLNFKGIGSGGDGEAVPVMQQTTAESTEETTVEQINFVDVNIDGENYLYNNNSYSLDDLMAEISKIEGEFEVHISLNDTATLAAREALEARLDENGILHEIVE